MVRGRSVIGDPWCWWRGTKSLDGPAQWRWMRVAAGHEDGEAAQESTITVGCSLCGSYWSTEFYQISGIWALASLIKKMVLISSNGPNKLKGMLFLIKWHAVLLHSLQYSCMGHSSRERHHYLCPGECNQLDTGHKALCERISRQWIKSWSCKPLRTTWQLASWKTVICIGSTATGYGAVIITNKWGCRDCVAYNIFDFAQLVYFLDFQRNKFFLCCLADRFRK